jgi:hypothetical protein
VEYLLANSELLITIGVVLSIVAYAIFARPWLRRNGYLNTNDVAFAQQWVAIIRLIIKEVDFKGKTETLIVIDLVRVAVKHVKDTVDVESVDTLKTLSKQAVLDSLKILNIKPTNSQLEMIDLSIDALLNDVKL